MKPLPIFGSGFVIKRIFLRYTNRKTQQRTMYNTYKNRRGQIVPKSAVIRNTPELDKLKKDFSIYGWSDYIWKTHEWVMIGISPAQSGNLYANVNGFSERDYNIFVNDYSIVFDDIEKLKKYLRWALNLPRHVVNSK